MKFFYCNFFYCRWLSIFLQHIASAFDTPSMLNTTDFTETNRNRFDCVLSYHLYKKNTEYTIKLLNKHSHLLLLLNTCVYHIKVIFQLCCVLVNYLIDLITNKPWLKIYSEIGVFCLQMFNMGVIIFVLFCINFEMQLSISSIITPHIYKIIK